MFAKYNIFCLFMYCINMVELQKVGNVVDTVVLLVSQWKQISHTMYN